MKSLASKLFFAASIVMMSLTISCKDKPTETEVDVDVVDTTMIEEPVAPTTPDTTTVPADTTTTPAP